MSLALILMNFSVEPVPKTPSAVEFDPTSVTLKAKGGIPLKFVTLDST